MNKLANEAAHPAGGAENQEQALILNPSFPAAYGLSMASPRSRLRHLD